MRIDDLEKGEIEMEMVKVTEIAQALYNAHGDKAELEAAKRQNTSEEAGDKQEAANWKAIRSSIRRLKGANQS
jgi:hypothetical protein